MTRTAARLLTARRALTAAYNELRAANRAARPLLSPTARAAATARTATAAAAYRAAQAATAAARAAG